jgi:hypothetical protein
VSLLDPIRTAKQAGAKMVIILNVAGVLWLVIGANQIFAQAPPLTFEHNLVGGILMSFGMLFIAIGGIISALNKLADSQARRL